jgi:hypothetical protein
LAGGELVGLTERPRDQAEPGADFASDHDHSVQVIPQQAINDKGHTGALYSKNSDLAAGAGVWGGTFYYGVGVRSLRRCVVER